MSFKSSLSIFHSKTKRWGDLASHDVTVVFLFDPYSSLTGVWIEWTQIFERLQAEITLLELFGRQLCCSSCMCGDVQLLAAVYKGTNHRTVKSNVRAKDEQRNKMSSRRLEHHRTSSTSQSFSASLDASGSAGPRSGLVITGERTQVEMQLTRPYKMIKGVFLGAQAKHSSTHNHGNTNSGSFEFKSFNSSAHIEKIACKDLLLLLEQFFDR
eukprot:763403-Hanusia_phi.AAC.9